MAIVVINNSLVKLRAKVFFIALCFWCALFFLFANAQAQKENPFKLGENSEKNAAQTGEIFTEDQVFRGALRRDISLVIAKAKARYRAMNNAARALALRQDVKIMAGKIAATQPIDPVGLAYAVYDIKILAPELSGFSPELTVRASLTIVPRHSGAGENPLDLSVTKALNNLELVNLYSESVKQENIVLKEIIPLAEEVMRSAPKSKAEELDLSTRFSRLADQINSIDKFRSALTQLESGTWKDPEGVVEKMQSALLLDPTNSLVLATLGENLLVLSKPQEAIEYLTAAIKLQSDSARLYNIRGAAYLSIHLPVLANSDFSSAIRLKPDSASYYNARGATWLFQEDYPKMCQDFYAACTFGQCKNYEWAVERNFCKPQ